MTDTRHKTTIEIGVEDREVEQLQKQLSRTFDPKAIDTFQRGIERATKAFEKMGSAARKAGFTGGSMGGGGFGGGGGGGGGGNAGPGNVSQALHGDIADLRKAIRELVETQKKTNDNERVRQRDEATQRGGGLRRGAEAVAGFAGNAGAAAINGGFVGTMAAATASIIPIIGPAIGSVLAAGAQQAVALYQEHAQQQMAQAGAFGRTGIAGGYASAGMAYGIQPGAMPGILSSFSGTSGLEGSRLGGALPTQLRLSQLLGVERAGGIVSAGEAGGGTVDDPSELMMQAVSEGLAAGIRVTRLDQYLQNVSSWVEGVRSHGIDMRPESALRMVAGMSAAGLQGEAAAAAAQSMSAALGSAGRGQGVHHSLALQAAGLDEHGDYNLAVNNLESQDPETMRRYIESYRNMGGSVGARVAFFRRSEVGATLSNTAATQLIENGFDPNLMPNSGHANVALDDRRQRAGGVFRAGATMAGLAIQRQAVGARVGSTAIQLMQRDTQMVARILPAVVRALERFDEVIGAAIEGYDTNGAGGAVGNVLDATVNRALEAAGLPTLDTNRMASDTNMVVDALLNPGAAIDEAVAGVREMVGLPAAAPAPAPAPAPPPAESGDGGPTASLSRHLRNAAEAAERLGLPAEGDLTASA